MTHTVPTDPSKRSYTRSFLFVLLLLLAADGIISTGTGDASVARGGLLSLIFLYTRSPAIADITTAPATAQIIAPIGTLTVVPLVTPLADGLGYPSGEGRGGGWGGGGWGGGCGGGGGDWEGSTTDGGGGGGGDGGGGDGDGGGGEACR